VPGAFHRGRGVGHEFHGLRAGFDAFVLWPFFPYRETGWKIRALATIAQQRLDSIESLERLATGHEARHLFRAGPGDPWP